MIDSLLYAKLPPHLKRSINLAYSEKGTCDQIVAHLEEELEMSGLEIDGRLPIPTMATRTTTVNKQTQPQNAEQQQTICRYCKNVIKECRNDKVKIKLPKRQMWRHTHLVHTAKELTTQQTFAGMA